MYRLIALYHQPEDKNRFREHLSGVHLPIVTKFPKLRALRVGYDLKADREDAPYFAVVECDFDNQQDLEAALQSSAGQEAGNDVPNYAGAGVTIVTCNIANLKI